MTTEQELKEMQEQLKAVKEEERIKAETKKVKKELFKRSPTGKVLNFLLGK